MRVCDLPRKLRIVVLDMARGTPVPGVILSCEVHLVLRFVPVLPTVEGRDLPFVRRLTTLASDHVGYLAFSLEPIHRIVDELPELKGVKLTLEIAALHVYAPTQPHVGADLVDDLELREGDVADVLEAINAPLERVIPLELADYLPAEPGTPIGLPSIEEPDVDDWRLSPASFGMAQLPAIGEDGCLTLLPSNEPDQTYTFYQLQRIPSLKPETLSGPGAELPVFLSVKRGKLVEYQTDWRPLNHALGRVLYSLTLAPCEAVKIATLDWRRTDESVRAERTGLSDSLAHQQQRDRVVDETVDATIQEFQKGSSFMGGTAGVGGYGGQGQGQMWGVTGSHAIGTTDISTSGEREVEVETVQRIGDTVAQTSRMVRDLRSTVIVQATQRESEFLQTRTVRNHNHSHALTVLYYEVVRHYLLTSQAVRERDVLFIRYSPYSFDARTARIFRPILEPNLLDPGLADHFDDLGGTVPEDWYVAAAAVELFTPMDAKDIRGRVFFQLLTVGGIRRWSVMDGYVEPPGADGLGLFNNNRNTFYLRFDERIRVKDIHRLGINFIRMGDNHWVLGSMRVAFVITPGAEDDAAEDETGDGLPDNARMMDVLDKTEVNYDFQDDGDLWFSVESAEIDQHFRNLRNARDTVRRGRELLSHLADFRLYYSRIIWMNEDPDARASRFSQFYYPPGDSPTGVLSDFLDNAPLGVFGDYVAFAVGGYRSVDMPVSERIVSLPTRGTFAETQLSHCNASEIIDDTRFWDWQRSPCGEEAPDITGIHPGSRLAASMIGTPTALPAPGVGITAPEAAPAPGGLGAILDAITKSDVFRDMSGKAELAAMLQELTRAAAEVEGKRIEGLTELGKQQAETERARYAAQGSSTGDGGGGTGGGETAGGGGHPMGGGGTPTGGPVPEPQPAPEPRPEPEPEPEPEPDRGGGGGGGRPGGGDRTDDETSTAVLVVEANFFTDRDGDLRGHHELKLWWGPGPGPAARDIWTSRDGNVRRASIDGVRENDSFRVQVLTYGAYLSEVASLRALGNLLRRGQAPPVSYQSFGADYIRRTDSKVFDPEHPTRVFRYTLGFREVTLRFHAEASFNVSLARSITSGLTLGLSFRRFFEGEIDLTDELGFTVGGEGGGGIEVELPCHLLTGTYVVSESEV